MIERRISNRHACAHTVYMHCYDCPTSILIWLKTFNRLRHRDKLTTVRLGWLGSAAYSRLLVKKDGYNR